MRFFRIPAFTGIEAHRDDADRGSLRVVEGCIPYGVGGLRSGPVWKDVGTATLKSNDDGNILTAADDGQGNSIVMASRLGEVHDISVISKVNTAIENFGDNYLVANPLGLYTEREATLSPVGNGWFAFGDGDGEAIFIGKNISVSDFEGVYAEAKIYSLEWSRFPNCRHFLVGPKKTLYATGNPDQPLRIYISEPAGSTSPLRDAPYSTEDAVSTAMSGQLSVVDLLMTDASEITALSSRGDQVIVHTDKGCHILYSPTSDQAETGYRVEQVSATNFSAAVNGQVVSGESGSMSFWFGHDGQIYKDESASRGAEDAKSYADPDQVTWKAKGVWESEQPVDLSQAFATYDRESGMYWVFIESDEHKDYIKGTIPAAVQNLEVIPLLPGQPKNLTIS